MVGRIRQQECDPSEACIRVTTKEIRTWMEDNPLISDLIMKITRDAKAFQCHPDKFDEAVNHAATFIFEWLFISIFKGYQATRWRSFSTTVQESCEPN